jgi:hypothetical protein
MRRVRSRSWELEKVYISTAIMVETVVADTDVKIRSMSMGLDVVMWRDLRIKDQETNDGDGCKVQELLPERVHMEKQKVVYHLEVAGAGGMQRSETHFCRAVL